MADSFINKLPEEKIIKNKDFTVFDVVDPNKGSYFTRKVTLETLANQISSNISGNFNTQIAILQSSINTANSQLQGKLDKTGLNFSPNEKMSGPLTVEATFTAKSGVEIYSKVDLHNNRITNIGTPISSTDVTSKNYVDTNVNNLSSVYVPLSGGASKPMTGSLYLNGDPTQLNHAANKNYVDTNVNKLSSIYIPLSGGVSNTMTGYLYLVGTPTQPNHAANKNYVDTQIPIAINNLNTSVNSIYLKKTTDSMSTGSFLTLGGDPTSLNHATNKNYVDTQIQAVSSLVATKTYVNSNFVPFGGGTMTGNLILNTDPTLTSNVKQAATKNYVDTNMLKLNNYIPLSGGTMTQGYITAPYDDPAVARNLVTKAYTDKTIDSKIKSNEVKYVHLTGSTMTGSLLLNAHPTAASNNFTATTKFYVDTSTAANSAKGLEKTTDGFGIKLASGGGLQFNTDGQLKLTPPAANTNVVVVRPSDASSTDAFVSRSNVNGELSPYFKTLTRACTWARDNLTGNIVIFVDEDTVEGSGGEVSYNVNTENCTVVFITQAKIDSITSMKGKGFKAGLYVWSRDGINPIAGMIDFWSIGTNNRSTTTYVRPRYLRGGVWSEQRRFTDPPKNINFNIYISTDRTLIAPPNSDGATDSNFGSDSTVWSRYTGTGNADLSWFYLRSTFRISDSRMEFKSMNFVCRTNAPDITSLWIIKSDVWLYNCSLSLLGEGFYNYAPVWVTDSSELRLHGFDFLASDVAGSGATYPGYGLAIIGNKKAGGTFADATKVNWIFKAEANSRIRQIDWSPAKVNNSMLGAAVILDGDFVVNDSIFLQVIYGSEYEGFPVFVSNGFKVYGERFTNESSLKIKWFTSLSDVDCPGTFGFMAPFWHNKNNSIRLYNNFGVLRKHTLFGGVDNSSKAAYGIPMFFADPDSHGKNPSFNWGIGGFRNSAGADARPLDVWTLFTGVDNQENRTTNYDINFNTRPTPIGTDNNNPSDVGYPSLPYLPVSLLPQFSTFYVFTEGGATKTLDHGTGVRL